MRRVKLLTIGFTALISCAALITGCGSGGTDGDTDDSFSGTFVATDSTVGTITVTPNETRFPVSETTGFRVQVNDANGRGVPNIQIACDTEQGLALIEPTSGFELTDAGGQMSGRVGCEAPGSYTMVCRLPIGTNLRRFVTFVCEGDIPAGFTGFGGGGGGGLGGGAVNPGDGATGGTGLDGVRITLVEFIDDGGATTTSSIDTRQDTCNEGDSDETCEEFFDTSVQFTVVNNSNQVVDAVSYTYTVSDSNGSGSSYTSPSLALNGQEVLPSGGTATFTALFAEVISGVDADSCPLGKRFTDNSTAIPSDLGFTNITFRITVRNENGDSDVISVRGSASFDNFRDVACLP